MQSNTDKGPPTPQRPACPYPLSSSDGTMTCLCQRHSGRSCAPEGSSGKECSARWHGQGHMPFPHQPVNFSPESWAPGTAHRHQEPLRSEGCREGPPIQGPPARDTCSASQLPCPAGGGTGSEGPSPMACGAPLAVAVLAALDGFVLMGGRVPHSHNRLAKNQILVSFLSLL